MRDYISAVFALSLPKNRVAKRRARMQEMHLVAGIRMPRKQDMLISNH